MGTRMVSSDVCDISYFSGRARVRGHEYLVAMVVRERWPAPRRPWWRALVAAIRHLVALRSQRHEWQPPEHLREWESTTGTGAREILCSPSRGLLRVMDTDLPLPPAEQTLVVAVRESDGSGRGQVTGQSVRRLPLLPPDTPDPAVAPKLMAEQMMASTTAMWARWGESLRADAELQNDPVLQRCWFSRKVTW